MEYSFFANLSVIFFYTGSYNFTLEISPLQHTWSLSVEEIFYLIFPIIFAFFGLRNFKRFAVFALFLAPVLRVLTYIYTENFDGYDFLSVAWNFHTNIDVLATGCCLALFQANLRENKFYRYFLNSRLMILVAFSLIIFVAFFAEKSLLLFYFVGITTINLIVALCIDWIIFNRQSLAGKFLNLRPVRFVGVLSYSIYLWQQPFSFYTEGFWWTYFPYNLILLSIFSLFSYYLVEKVFLRYRQILEKRFSGTRQTLIPSKVSN